MINEMKSILLAVACLGTLAVSASIPDVPGSTAARSWADSVQKKSPAAGDIFSKRGVDDGTITKRAPRFDRCEAFASEQACRDTVENCKTRVGYQKHQVVSAEDPDAIKCVLDELAKLSLSEDPIPVCRHFKSDEACHDKIGRCKAKLLRLGQNVINVEDERFQECILSNIQKDEAREFDLEGCRDFSDETDCRFAWYACRKDLLSHGRSNNDKDWKPEFSQCMQKNIEQVDRERLSQFRYDNDDNDNNQH